MPRHTPAKRAKNRRNALKKLREKVGGQFTEKEGAAALRGEFKAKTKAKVGGKLTSKTISGLARNAAASNASRKAKRKRRGSTFK